MYLYARSLGLITLTESHEPAFLRELRGKHGGRDFARHEPPLARPRKQIIGGGEEDQPIYVVEGNQTTISKSEYEALLSDTHAGKQNDTGSPSRTQDVVEAVVSGNGDNNFTGEVSPAKQQVAGIGTSTKRRLARIIGDNEEEENGSRKEDDTREKSKVKKAKKVKLSFDEETIEP